MPISQTSTEVFIDTVAREAALAITEQPHYWRGNPPELQVSKTDLETDIAWVIAKLLRELTK